MKSKEEHLQLIRTMWEAYHPEYFECHLKKFPDYYKFFAEGGVIDDFSFALLGDVQGLRLLDTCCAGDAVQAFSWHNLGAKVTACDISPMAVDLARMNAERIGLHVDVRVADAQTLTPIPDNSQDIVFATYICWYEDLRLACRNWYRVLKPGGRLLYRGIHPAAAVLGEAEGRLKVEEDYFDRKPDYYQFDATSAGREYGVNVDKPAVNFRHTLADIVNAICDAGFTLERLVETKKERKDFPQLSLLPHELAVVARSKSGV